MLAKGSIFIFAMALMLGLSPKHSLAQESGEKVATDIAYSTRSPENFPPSEYSKIIPLLLNKLNNFWEKTQHTRRELEYFPDLSGKVNPELEIIHQDNLVIKKFKINRHLAGNPLYIQEVLLQNSNHFGNTLNTLGFFGKALPKGIEQFKKMELGINAKEGSPYAQKDLLRSELESTESAKRLHSDFLPYKLLPEALKILYIQEISRYYHIPLTSHQDSTTMIVEFYDGRIAELKRKILNADQRARAQLRIENRYLADPARRLAKDELEKLPFKLNDLVLRNDRQGVASIFESYLPLDIMEPVERAMWRQWLDAIRNPDLKNSVVLYRGLDPFNDKVQRNEIAGKENVGLFSVLLNRNQGSFTRRLRSLLTMRYKIMSTLVPSLPAVSPVNNAPTISQVMRNHAIEPKGSPFLSFTTDVAVAQSFAVDGIVAVNVDKRRILPNITGYAGDLEMLIPLVIFPDEIVAFERRNQDLKTWEMRTQNFMEKVKAVIVRNNLVELPSNDVRVLFQAVDIFSNLQSQLSNQCRKIFN